MNRFYKLLFLIPLIIIGCRNKDIEDKVFIQSIDSFNMNIYSNEGKKLYRIKSPYSIYNKEKNIFQLKETTINIYKSNEIEYIINSDESKLSNNYKLIELNGNVLVKYHQKDDELYANSFTWNINNSEYLLTGNVKFENTSITLNSNKAVLNKNNNIIEFYNPVKYMIKDNNEEKRFEINSENAYYNIITKSVSFSSKKERVRSKIYF